MGNEKEYEEYGRHWDQNQIKRKFQMEIRALSKSILDGFSIKKKKRSTMKSKFFCCFGLVFFYLKKEKEFGAGSSENFIRRQLQVNLIFISKKA